MWIVFDEAVGVSRRRDKDGCSRLVKGAGDGHSRIRIVAIQSMAIQDRDSEVHHHNILLCSRATVQEYISF